MKKYLYTLSLTLLLAACGDEHNGSQRSKPQGPMTIAQMSKQAQDLATVQNSYDARFKSFYADLTDVNNLLPKLNNDMQAELQKASKSNNAAATKLHNALSKQFNSVNQEINNLGKQMAAKGY